MIKYSFNFSSHKNTSDEQEGGLFKNNKIGAKTKVGYCSEQHAKRPGLPAVIL